MAYNHAKMIVSNYFQDLNLFIITAQHTIVYGYLSAAFCAYDKMIANNHFRLKTKAQIFNWRFGNGK